MFVCKEHLFRIYFDSLTLSSRPTAYPCLNKAYLIHIFSIRHARTFWHFGVAPLQHCTQRPFKQRNQQRTQKCEKHGAKETAKRTRVQCELRQEGRVMPCPTSAGDVRIGRLPCLASLGTSANDCETTLSTDLGITSKF